MIDLKINWNKITDWERELRHLRIANTRKEDIIFSFLEDSVRKNPENPFEFQIHIKDFVDRFKIDILRKTMENTNHHGLTTMINKYVGNYFVHITKLSIIELRHELVILGEIAKELPEDSQLGIELQRLKKRWMILKKYDMYLEKRFSIAIYNKKIYGIRK